MDEITRKTRLSEVLETNFSKSAEDQRKPFQRDRDRVLYSKAFRRLAGVSQVARTDEPFSYHNRLSHSLKVSQVAESLADILIHNRKYNKINISDHLNKYVVQTAGLAHDLGHPPFGHAAEQVLKSEIPDKYGSFEGNAQSFRITAKTEIHRSNEPGLNLTLASYNAILKYPWSFEERQKHTDEDKWGYYPTEKQAFERIREIVPEPEKRTLEAEIMDYADNLTYAIHDMEDFYRAGIIPLGQILNHGTERERVVEYVSDKEEFTESQVHSVFDTLEKELIPSDKSTLYTPFTGTEKEISELNRFTSQLIERYLAPFNDSEVWVDEDTLELEIDDNFKDEIDVFSRLTRFYVIDDSSMRTQQWGQKRVIKRIYEDLTKSVNPENNRLNILSEPFLERVKKLDNNQSLERERIVVDLITSMTEQQASELYGRLTGSGLGSLREGILE